MSRSIQIFLGLAGVVFIGLILFPVFGRAPASDGPPSCQSRLKQIGLGFLQYAQDYDGMMPTVEASEGWANAIQIYIKSPQLFQCPSEWNGPAAQSDPKLTGYTDYFYNAQLQKRSTEQFNHSASLIMAAEGNDGQENTNATYAKTALPPAWRSDTSSPAYRHLGMGTYLFADGHAKSLKVAQISTNWKEGGYYFQPPKPKPGPK